MVDDIFTKLVKIASPSGDESELGKYIVSRLGIIGISSYLDTEGNLLARAEGRGTPVLLSGHLDTVQGKSSIKPKIKDGVLKSSGNTILGADNKAALAGILHALTVTPPHKRKNLEIVFSVREETDGGVSKIDLSWLKSKSGISADSGKPIGTIISDTPFMEGFRIRVIGKSSHSSEPEKGINALSIASHAISNFKWGNVDEISTVNIGLIEGGSAVNTTPGSITLIGEIRSYKKNNLDKIKQDIEMVFKSSAKVMGGKVNFRYEYYCDGYSYDDTENSYRTIRKIYKKLKIEESFSKDLGASDANFFNSKGINVVDIGDGVFDPHTKDESVSLNDLNKLAEIFRSYITHPGY